MKRIKIIFSSIAIITIVLIIIGFVFNKTEDEKLNGLTEIFDVSKHGVIAYVTYHEAKPSLYLKTEQEEQLSLQLDADKLIMDIAFSPDGASLVYTTSNKDVETSLESSISILDVDSLVTNTLFHKPNLVTEIAFDPKDDEKLFYLQADTFENYSPIARANPHDFDIYHYHLSDDEHTKHTNFKNYAMDSLQISSKEEAVYIQMFDDENSMTAEDVFAQNQRIFKIPLANPEQLSIISDEERDVDIYDFHLVANEQAVVFQSISNINEGTTFQYELYYYDLESKEEKQLTNLQEFTSRPIITANGEVYFLVDRQFAQRYTDFYLYKMDLDGDNLTEIHLDHR